MKRRILGLTTSYPLHRNSSAGVFVRYLYRNLPPEWTVDVICPDDNGKSATSDPIDPSIHRVRYAPRAWQLLAQQSGGIIPGLRHAPWRMAFVPVLLLALTWKCARLAKRADLIHANWALCGAIAVLVGSLRGIPVVTTLRGDDITRIRCSGLERQLLNIAVQGSRHIICVSGAMMRQLQAQYPKHATKISTCLNGIDEIFFHISRDAAKPSEAVHVIAIGSLIPRKGYDVLIDAVAIMRHRDRVRITIVGEGPLRMNLSERMAQKGVSEQFELIGEVPPDRVPELLSRADLFVLVSRSEGRPNVINEALASGLPVISSRLPGIEGLVVEGENGWIVDIGDSAAVASALDQAILEPSERLRRGIVARDEMQKLERTWFSTGLNYSQIFIEALRDQ